VADLPAGNGPVLAPLAELAGTTVVEGLTAKGWRVDRVEAYRTVTPAAAVGAAAAMTGHEVDLVTFFSPSAVNRWVDRFGTGATPGPPAVCVGPATAARAEARGLASIVVADPHTEAGVLAAVERTLAGRSSDAVI
jgi:uroporphyrinogen-III synthase